jgi:hypothetical protein
MAILLPRSWLEAPSLHRFHGIVVEAFIKALDDFDVRRLTLAIDDASENDLALHPIAHGAGVVLGTWGGDRAR